MNNLLEQLELLTGQKSPLEETFDKNINIKAFDEGGIGVSLMNELLLTAGFDRITNDFFSLLCKGKPEEYEYEEEALIPRIHGIKDLTEKVGRLRKLAILKYGNFKFAFKQWSRMNVKQLERELSDLVPKGLGYLVKRAPPLEDIERIPINDRYLLGHISGEEESPDLQKRREDAQKKAAANLCKYLTFDHMDVYVATSMRTYRDYISVGEFVQKIFNHQSIKELGLRYFDPTQTFSCDPIREGLVESLMLKRAKCAIYCAQETDTLGKDSELAITLAQGKPVLAYVPKVTDLEEYQEKLIQDSRSEKPANPIESLRRYFIKYFPEQAMSKLALLQRGGEEMIASELAALFQQRFEERANILHRVHPLAMQVDLNTGVAHGVLLVRDANTCIKVLRKVLFRELEFDLEEQTPSYPEYARGDYKKTYILREKITGSPFRVVIGDELLTNSFWNFYLK